MSGKNKKESILVKIYLIFLFVCGITVWLAIQPTNNNKISTDVILDSQIVDILIHKRVKQEDILKQYIREKTTSVAQWNEFYKTIKIKRKVKIKEFEKSFRSLARSMKLGLSRIDNSDGSVTYKFYSPSRTYSNITFVKKKGHN
ncbi:MAG: hypothetical protein LBD61_00465 [Endomicrobium sp.]|nr:hypothetical protein [Endomicrobium sp.]